MDSTIILATTCTNPITGSDIDLEVEIEGEFLVVTAINHNGREWTAKMKADRSFVLFAKAIGFDKAVALLKENMD